MANDTELERKQLQVFCGGAGEQQTSVFGTMKNPAPDYSKDPETLQGTNWPQGWQNAIAADDAPFMEDMNSLFYVLSYMIKYLYQHGIPEWSNKETYTASKSVVLRNGKFYLAKQTTGADNPQDPATDSSNTYWYLALDPVNPAADQNWVKGYAQSLANLSQTIDGSTTKYPSNKAVQNAVGAKQNTITGAATTIVSSNLATNRALISDGSGKVAVSAVTSTELGYLDGVTSAIQTQLNGKANTSLSNISSTLDVVTEKGTNFMKFKSGTLICWGVDATPSGAGQGTQHTVTLPKAYANNTYSLANCWEFVDFGSGRRDVVAGSFTTTNFKWMVKSGAGNYDQACRSFRWITIGRGA